MTSPAPRDPFTPTREDRFTFGLWTVGNPGLLGETRGAAASSSPRT